MAVGSSVLEFFAGSMGELEAGLNLKKPRGLRRASSSFEWASLWNQGAFRSRIYASRCRSISLGSCLGLYGSGKILLWVNFVAKSPSRNTQLY